MAEFLEVIALVAATVTTGLFAGLFYAFAIAVMPGLRRCDDRTFVQAMHHMNTAILNGWFVLIFVGAAAWTILAAVLSLGGEDRSTLMWILAALALHGATLAITFAVNVPLNDSLNAAGTADHDSELALVRERFEARWVRWNVARALASTAATGCLAWALVLHGRT